MKSDKAALGASAVVLLATLLAGCASSTDGFVEEGSQDRSPEQNLVKGLMQGLGAVDPTDRPADFKPRAPLVAPPGRNLPAPRDADAAVGANFPRNPEDVADDQRRAAAGRSTGANGRIMTPDELAKYAIPGAGRQQQSSTTGTYADPSRPMKPDQLAGESAIQAEAVKRAANPTGRKSLIEPPDDYRRPSPNAPVVAPEEKSSWHLWPF